MNGNVGINPKAKSKEGTGITFTVPFTYVIGEAGPYTGNILETLEDAENEFRQDITIAANDPGLSFDVTVE